MQNTERDSEGNRIDQEQKDETGRKGKKLSMTQHKEDVHREGERERERERESEILWGKRKS